MKNKRRNHSALFKAKVALEAAKGKKTMEELHSHFGVNNRQITQWKKQLLESMQDILSRRRHRTRKKLDELNVNL